MKERVLVIGANGFIGFHLVSELISNKIPVTALVKNSSPTNNLKKIGCYNIINTNNLNDSSIIRQLLLSKPKYVVNCMWEKTKSDDLMSLRNTQLLTDILNLTKEINSEKFINIGTYQEYGVLDNNIDEKQSPSPKTDFGKLKLAHCLTLLEISKSLNIKACHLRLAETYSSNKPDSFIFKSLIKCIAAKDKKSFSFPNKKNDYIYVSDVCRAIIYLINSNASGIFNVGTDQAFPNKDLVNMIMKQSHSSIKLEPFESSENFSLNINKIYNITGWKPSISIWDGISLLLQEEKFKKPHTLDDFTSTIRSLYK